MKMKNTKMEAILSFIAVTTLNIGATTSTCMANVLTVVAAEFPDVPYTNIYQLITVPSLVTMITAILIGTVVGRKIKYRTVVLAGLVIYFFGALSPLFIHGSFSTLMLVRVIFGVGLGCLSLGSAIILSSYTGQEQARYLSINSMVYTILSLCINTVSGILGNISYTVSYFIYFVGLLPFIGFLFFFKEPEASLKNIEANKQRKLSGEVKVEEKKKGSFKVSPIALFWAFMGFVLLLMKYPVALQVSVFTDEMGLANSTVVAGTLMSAYQIGGFVGATTFPILNKKFSRWLFPGYCLLVVANMVLCLMTTNVILYYVGYFLGGLGFNTSGLVRSTYIGATQPKDSMAFLTGISTAFIYGSMYLTPYYMNVVNPIVNNIRGTNFETANWWFCGIGWLVIAVIFIVKDARPKAYKEVMEATQTAEPATEAAAE